MNSIMKFGLEKKPTKLLTITYKNEKIDFPNLYIPYGPNKEIFRIRRTW